MAVVISIDAGTTGVRAFAVDEHGVPCGLRTREISQYFPRPGWVEHDADEIWSTTQAVVAMSSGESELYSLTKGSAQALGLLSLAADLGLYRNARLHTDASEPLASSIGKA